LLEYQNANNLIRKKCKDFEKTGIEKIDNVKIDRKIISSSLRKEMGLRRIVYD